jgi:hypothetical protein
VLVLIEATKLLLALFKTKWSWGVKSQQFSVLMSESGITSVT